MKKILVTGASGCIGSWTTLQLLQEGHQVVAADISENTARMQLVLGEALDHANLSRIRLDVCDRPAVEALMRSQAFDAVIHLAALQIPLCKDNPIGCVDVNVKSHMIFLELLRERSFKYCFASSTAVYGPPIGRAFDEHDNIHPATLYGVFKYAAEEMARVYHADYGVNSAALRPWAVYGPGRDVGLTSDPTMALLSAARGKPFHIRYDGAVGMEHAEDVARAFVLATLRQKPGAHVYTLGGPVVPVRDVVATIDDLLGVDGLITVDQEVLPVASETVDASFQDHFGPFDYMALRDGFERTLSFWRARGLI